MNTDKPTIRKDSASPETLRTQAGSERQGQATPHAPECLFHNTLEEGDCDCDALRLTPREHEVLQLVRRGLIAREISETLGIAFKTVGNLKRAINHKLGVAYTQSVQGTLLVLCACVLSGCAEEPNAFSLDEGTIYHIGPFNFDRHGRPYGSEKSREQP